MNRRQVEELAARTLRFAVDEPPKLDRPTQLQLLGERTLAAMRSLSKNRNRIASIRRAIRDLGLEESSP